MVEANFDNARAQQILTRYNHSYLDSQLKNTSVRTLSDWDAKFRRGLRETTDKNRMINDATFNLYGIYPNGERQRINPQSDTQLEANHPLVQAEILTRFREIIETNEIWENLDDVHRQNVVNTLGSYLLRLADDDYTQLANTSIPDSMRAQEEINKIVARLNFYQPIAKFTYSNIKLDVTALQIYASVYKQSGKSLQNAEAGTTNLKDGSSVRSAIDGIIQQAANAGAEAKQLNLEADELERQSKVKREAAKIKEEEQAGLVKQISKAEEIYQQIQTGEQKYQQELQSQQEHQKEVDQKYGDKGRKTITKENGLFSLLVEDVEAKKEDVKQWTAEEIGILHEDLADTGNIANLFEKMLPDVDFHSGEGNEFREAVNELAGLTDPKAWTNEFVAKAISPSVNEKLAKIKKLAVQFGLKEKVKEVKQAFVPIEKPDISILLTQLQDLGFEVNIPAKPVIGEATNNFDEILRRKSEELQTTLMLTFSDFVEGKFKFLDIDKSRLMEELGRIFPGIIKGGRLVANFDPNNFDFVPVTIANTLGNNFDTNNITGRLFRLSDEENRLTNAVFSQEGFRKYLKEFNTALTNLPRENRFLPVLELTDWNNPLSHSTDMQIFFSRMMAYQYAKLSFNENDSSAKAELRKRYEFWNSGAELLITRSNQST